MAKYQLLYFNLMGRAEISRLIFAQAGVEYEDKRLTRDDWNENVKPTISTGQLPVLSIDCCKVQIPHSMAIARYLAREFGLFGSDNVEVAQIDSLCESVQEYFELGVRVRFSSDEASKAAAVKAFKEKATTVFGILENVLEKSSSGFFVGDKVSLVDIVVFHDLTSTIFSGSDDFQEVQTQLKTYDQLTKHHKKIANLPRIKAWLAKRPKTEI